MATRASRHTRVMVVRVPPPGLAWLYLARPPGGHQGAVEDTTTRPGQANAQGQGCQGQGCQATQDRPGPGPGGPGWARGQGPQARLRAVRNSEDSPSPGIPLPSPGAARGVWLTELTKYV